MLTLNSTAPILWPPSHLTNNLRINQIVLPICPPPPCGLLVVLILKWRLPPTHRGHHLPVPLVVLSSHAHNGTGPTLLRVGFSVPLGNQGAERWIM